MWKVIIVCLLISDAWHLVIADFRFKKLEHKDSFTVVCGKYKYRQTTLDYVGYDCKILGGKHVK